MLYHSKAPFLLTLTEYLDARILAKQTRSVSRSFQTSKFVTSLTIVIGLGPLPPVQPGEHRSKHVSGPNEFINRRGEKVLL